MADERITKPARDVRMDSKREYSEIEIEIAKNLFAKGYEWIARDKDDRVYAYGTKPVKGEDEWAVEGSWLLLMSGGARGVIPIFDGIRWEDEDPVRLRDIVPQILTDEEREWLRTVAKPFRDRLRSVRAYDGTFYGRYIGFCVAPPEGMEGHGNGYFFQISKGSFEGMEDGKDYTPEELGL